MQMDTRLPLLGVSPQPINALAMGQEAGALAQEYQDVNALRQVMQQQGAAAMRGDMNALGAIARFDPVMGQRLQAGKMDMDLAQSAEKRAGEAHGIGMRVDSARLRQIEQQSALEAKRFAAENDARVVEQERATLIGAYEAARVAAEMGPEEWDRLNDGLGEEYANAPFEDAPIILAKLRGTLGGLQAAPEVPAAFRTLQARAEAAGLRPGTPEYAQFMAEGDAPRTTIQTNVNTDGGLQGELDKREAEVWKSYMDAGAVSAANAADFQVLGELVEIAPTGPLQGRLAQALPGVSSAADGFQSIVKRIAPTLRAPGSGATSDIEYQGMLQSMPQLVSKPEANRLILGIMQAKQQINIERAEVVQAFRNGEMDAATARKAMAEIGSRSIMTPEMRALIGGVSEAGGEDDEIDAILQRYQ